MNEALMSWLKLQRMTETTIAAAAMAEVAGYRGADWMGGGLSMVWSLPAEFRVTALRCLQSLPLPNPNRNPNRNPLRYRIKIKIRIRIKIKRTEGLKKQRPERKSFRPLVLR